MKIKSVFIHSKQLRSVFFMKRILFVLLLLLLLPVFTEAQGDLLITPRRVVFEGNNQREEITLANTGQDTASYSISFIQYYMNDDGSFEEVTDPKPGQIFADSYLRYFPRSVELAPGESQVVRMQVRRKPNMAEGEYRSHLYFRAVPDEKPLGENDLKVDSTSIGIKLTPIFGISIPVILRIGKLSASVTLSDLKMEKKADTPPRLSLVFNRSGNRSVYGDLNVYYISPEGEEVSVGIVRGIAVYTPNTVRRFSLQLNIPEGVDISAGKLRVKYTSSNEAESKVYDEKELILN